MSEITRSHGVAIQGTGIIVGGGYAGATEALDNLVQHAAENLREAYGLDVTIRFNSDRKSGSAWLVTDAVDTVGSNAEIGIRVVQHSISHLREFYAKRDMDVNERFARDGIDLEALEANGLDGYFTYHAHIGNGSLKDLTMATDQLSDPSKAYAHVRVGSVSEALEFLQENAVTPQRSSAPGPR